MDNRITDLLGKCCAGKDTMAKHMKLQFKYNFVISTTTRPMRNGESEGNPYHFISNEEFEDGIWNGKFIEYMGYKRDDSVWYYGVSKDEIEDYKSYVAVLDIIGLREFRKAFGNRVFATYLDVPESERLERCKRRGDYNEEEWIRRKESDDLMFTNDVIEEIGDIQLLTNNNFINKNE